MVGLNGYTLCSGILCDNLNGSDYLAVKLKSDEVMTIGYLKRKGIALSRWDRNIWRRSGNLRECDGSK